MMVLEQENVQEQGYVLRIFKLMNMIPSPEDLPNTGIKLGSPALQADSLPTENSLNLPFNLVVNLKLLFKKSSVKRKITANKRRKGERGERKRKGGREGGKKDGEGWKQLSSAAWIKCQEKSSPSNIHLVTRVK